MGRFTRYIWFGALTLALCSLFSVSRAQSDGASSDEPQMVDVKAELVYPHKVNDTLTVLCLVGNFAAQHNGAVITADSAVRYEDQRLECFGNVLLNKNTTYAYADKAIYDSGSNLASLFSPMIKLIDEDVTIYAYNFSLNTLTNIGYYWGGGITTKGDEAMMESLRGYYSSENKLVTGVDEVELEGEDYLMQGDSVIYDMNLDRAHFFTNTNIWNEQEDYIFGDRGLYRKDSALYSVTRNGYILTKEQEVWSDSLDYYREQQMAILRHNIQIDDTTNKVLAFGDYAQYWGDVEQALITRHATIISYDLDDPQLVDSLFVSGDSILMITYSLNEGPAADKANADSNRRKALLAELMGAGVDVEEESPVEEESFVEEDELIPPDSTIVEPVIDSVVIDTLPVVLPTKKELKAAAKRAKAAKKSTLRSAKQQEREDLIAARLRAIEVREYRKLVERREKLEVRIEERRIKGRNLYADSMILIRVMGEMRAIELAQDTMKIDSVVDEIFVPLVDIDDISRDSLYRVFKVFRNARIYRTDMQSASDSLIAISYDTTMQLHLSPIIWSQKNQITADHMYLYTKDGELSYADLDGDPIMSSKLSATDTIHFNQVTGKKMQVLFEDNSVRQNNVDGNVQTIYYMQDEATLEATTMADVQSAAASFFIVDQELDGVVYRGSPNYIFAPLDKLPEELSFYLPEFKWFDSIRPTRETIFTRDIRPSQREVKSSLELPQFPIKRKITAERHRLVESGEWRDRDEGVSEEATLWMQGLGFTPGEPRKEGESIF